MYSYKRKQNLAALVYSLEMEVFPKKNSNAMSAKPVKRISGWTKILALIISESSGGQFD